MAEKEPKPRFKERKDRDDEDDDDRPRKRSREDDDDDDEDDDDEGEGRGRRRRARQRVVGSDRPPVLFLLGLVFGTVLLLGCCGVGGWGAYSVLVGGGSGFNFGSEVEITGASRLSGFGPNTAPTVSWFTVGKANVADFSGAYFVVMKCGGKTHVEPHPIPIKAMTVSGSKPIPEFRGLTGPVEVWVERRTNPNKDGTRVSNVYRIP